MACRVRFLVLLLLVLGCAAAAVPAGAAPKVLSSAEERLYRSALAAIEKEKWAEAREIAAKGNSPTATKIIQWMDLVRPGPGRSFAELTDFIRDNPTWPGQFTLQIQAEKAMPATLSADEVVAWFAGRRPRSVEGALRLGSALIEKGMKDAAADVVRTAWVELDMQPADELLMLTRFFELIRPGDHQARLDRLLWAGQRTAATRMMERVDSDHRALAAARIALMAKEPDAGGRIAAVPPKLRSDPGLLFDLARWHRRNDRFEAAAATLDVLPPDAPRPDAIWDEMEDAARRAFARGDVALAYRLARNHGSEKGSAFADGEWLAGWIALRFLDDRRVAYDHFTRLYAGVSTAISQSRAAYWAGRAAEDLGDVALAQNWYAAGAEHLTTYYGQLAAHKIGKADALAFDPAPLPTKAETDAFRKNELVEAARILAQLEQSDRLRTFLVRLSDYMTTPGEMRLLADLSVEIGRDDMAVMVAKKARLAGVPLLSYLYPLRKLPTGDDPEPALLLAVIRQESAFSKDAVSSAGALGLMQLMPATAKNVAKKLGMKYDRDRLTQDPDYNIMLGRGYIDQMLDRFNGSYVLAIASYNAGPNRAEEWMRQYGDPRDYGVDVIDWVESIPFSETRNYVQRVMENLLVYRHRLDQTQIAMSLEHDLLRTGR